VIVNCSGAAQGFTVLGSDVILRNLTFYVTSSNNAAYGFWYKNNSSTTANRVADCFNVTGTVDGTSVEAWIYAAAFLCQNVNDANTITLNLNQCRSVALEGTTLDVGVGVISTTTNNAIVNVYLGTIDGGGLRCLSNRKQSIKLRGFCCGQQYNIGYCYI